MSRSCATAESNTTSVTCSDNGTGIVPTGLDSITIAANPTLKRGANQHCASGASVRDIWHLGKAQELVWKVAHLTVAITGASGAVFGREMLRALEADARVARVHFVASENSLRVLAEELGVSGRTGLLEKLLGAAPTKTVQLSDADIGAAIASGSHPSNGMIMLPCSMGTLAAIANWAGQLADCARGRCDAQGTAAAGALRARDAVQSHSSAQYDAGRRGRRDHLPGAFRRSTTSQPTRPRWRASLCIACWRISDCRSRGRMCGRRTSSGS